MAPRERNAATSTTRNSLPRPAPATRRKKATGGGAPATQAEAPGRKSNKARLAKANPAKRRSAKASPAKERPAKASPAVARSTKASPGRAPAGRGRAKGQGAKAPELVGRPVADEGRAGKQRRSAVVRGASPKGARRAATPLAGPTPSAPPRIAASARPVTLAVDIGGTGIKGLLLDKQGKPVGEMLRILTPRPAVPARVLPVIAEIGKKLPGFDRVSVGFPGVVQDNTTKTAPNLHPSKWADFALGKTLERLLGKPARVINDAGVQGYGVVEGRGVEMLITLGTGMGCALFLDGRYVPNLELGHHPLRDGKTYEELVCDAELKRLGVRRWLPRVREVVDQILPIWNPRLLYIGGGNARLITGKLPPNVRVAQNVAGLLGGIALWRG